MVKADSSSKNGTAKKPYQRRLTDKRRAQNREAQKVWREKQKKHLEELKTIAGAAEAEQLSNVTLAIPAPPQPPAHDPPFDQYSASSGSLDGYEDVHLMCAASIDFWASIAGDERTRCAPWQREQASGSVLEIPADVDLDDFELLRSWTELDVLDGMEANVPDFHAGLPVEAAGEQTQGLKWMSMPWLGGMPMSVNEECIASPLLVSSKDPTTLSRYDDFTLASTAPIEPIEISAILANAAVAPQICNTATHIAPTPRPTPTTSTSTASTTTPAQSWTVLPSTLPSRTLHLTPLSIHLALATNALTFSLPPTPPFPSRFASPFYRPPTGPLTLAESSAAAATAADMRATWYKTNKASNWKSIKKWLRPTPAQLTRPHNLWIDTLPFPTLRERLLCLYQEIDGADLANDVAFNEGLVCWMSCDGVGAAGARGGAGGDGDIGARTSTIGAGKTGMGMGMSMGMPWDVRNWEVKPWFVRKWWSTGLLGDEEDEVWEQCVWWLQFREGLEEDGEGTLSEFLGSMRAL